VDHRRPAHDLPPPCDRSHAGRLPHARRRGLAKSVLHRRAARSSPVVISRDHPAATRQWLPDPATVSAWPMSAPAPAACDPAGAALSVGPRRLPSTSPPPPSRSQKINVATTASDAVVHLYAATYSTPRPREIRRDSPQQPAPTSPSALVDAAAGWNLPRAAPRGSMAVTEVSPSSANYSAGAAAPEAARTRAH